MARFDDAPPAPAPAKSRAPLIVLGCVIAAILLIGTCVVGGLVLKSKFDFNPVVDAFYQKVDSGDLKGAYASSHPKWQEAQTLEQFQDYFALVDSVMGKLQSRSFKAFNVV